MCDNLGDHLVGNVYIKVSFLLIFSVIFTVDPVNLYLSFFPPHVVPQRGRC